MTSFSMGERALAERALLSALYGTRAAAVQRVAHHHLGNQWDAEDLMHDAFLELWRSCSGQLAMCAEPLAWLVTISTSRAIDALRHQQVLLREHARERDEPKEEMVELDLDHLRRKQRLREALAAMSVTQRELIGLSFGRGLSHFDIAAETGMPVGTVKSRLRRALQQLQGELRCASH